MIIPGRADGVELDVWDGIFMHEPLSLDALYYRIPHSDLDKGLVKVENDHELNRMYDLSKVFMATIEFTRPLATPQKRYCNDFSKKEMVHWVEIEAQEEHVGDKGRGKVSDEKKKTTYVDRGKEKLMDEVVVASDGDSGNEGMLIDSDDNDYYDKSYDYLSARKEELIELRTRKTNRSKTRPTPIPYTFSNDYTSRAKVANKREVFVEHEDFIDDLFRKLKGLDSDGNMQDHFVGVEASEDKYPTYGEGVSKSANGYRLNESTNSMDGSATGLGRSASVLGRSASGVGGFGSGGVKGYDNPSFTSTQPHRRAFKRVGGVSFATRGGATSSEPCIRGYKKVSRRFARYFGTDGTTTTNTSGSQANASASQTEMYILSQKEIPSQATNELQMKTQNQSTRRLPKNYSSWKRSMMIALNAKNKLKIVTGELIEPNVDSDERALWERTNDMIISWILNTISDNYPIGHPLHDKYKPPMVKHTSESENRTPKLNLIHEQDNAGSLVRTDASTSGGNSGNDVVFVRMDQL
ncbi:multidrug resistance-associated protein 5 [Tanacetum coccineum]